MGLHFEVMLKEVTFYPECIVHFQFHYGHISYRGFFKEKGVSNGLCNESL